VFLWVKALLAAFLWEESAGLERGGGGSHILNLALRRKACLLSAKPLGYLLGGGVREQRRGPSASALEECCCRERRQRAEVSILPQGT